MNSNDVNESDSDDDYVPTMGSLSLILFYGSWNCLYNEELKGTNNVFLGITKQRMEEKLNTITHMLRDNIQHVYHEMSFGFDVDAESYSIDTAYIMVDENGDIIQQQQQKQSNPLPVDQLVIPSELPALILVYNETKPSGKTSIKQHKIISIPHRILLSYFKNQETTTSSSRLSMDRDTKMRLGIQNILNNMFPVVASSSSIPSTNYSKVTKEHLPSKSSSSQQQPLRIFIAGDKSSVGKSTICLGIISTLLHKYGYPPSQLAYVKPATQCEATTTVVEYCISQGMKKECVIGIGPIVYYKGYTKSFLKGEIGKNSIECLNDVSRVVDDLSNHLMYNHEDENDTNNGEMTNGNTDASNNERRRKVILIDGVGYPSVGSICGTCNAAVAMACGYPIIHSNNDTSTNNDLTTTSSNRIPPSILLIGKSGIGDAIDTYNLNASYFNNYYLKNNKQSSNDNCHQKMKVLGVIFNRLPSPSIEKEGGYYSYKNCKEAIMLYFNQRYDDNDDNDYDYYERNKEKVFGFVPEVESPTIQHQQDDSNNNDGKKSVINVEKRIVSTFNNYVNVMDIIKSVEEDLIRRITIERTNHNSVITNNDNKIVSTSSSLVMKKSSNNNNNQLIMTREKIEKKARLEDASSGSSRISGTA